MKHKGLVAAVASKTNQPENEIENMLQATIDMLKSQLVDGNIVNFQGFGSFEFKRKEERLSVHPATKIRTLIPPKQVMNFRQSATLKVKLKEIPHHE
ncbi:MAG: HU family DNA-binding protein [Paludibacter sp.]|nr:HU family DNA-binding protein [Paludibacter sp.]